jgi:hypothetical protein
MRDELRIPLGKLVADGAFSFEDVEGEKVITVGDVITRRFMSAGKLPWIAIIDGKTRREVLNSRSIVHDSPVNVRNPAGSITLELWNAIDDACKKEENTLIFVDGEEDLATLPAIFLAPQNAMVLYGMPDRGVVIVRAGEAKKKVEGILKRMEVKNGDKDG